MDHLSDDFAWRGKSMVARLDGAAGGFMITRGILVQGNFFHDIFTSNDDDETYL